MSEPLEDTGAGKTAGGDPVSHKAPERRRRAEVTTRTGDDGYTGLLGKERVPKWDARPDTFGTLDEATSALGLARALTEDDRIREIVLGLQKDLYLLMAELATGPDEYERSPLKLTLDHVLALEETAAQLKDEVQIGQQFIIPGETAAGAALDLARTIVRRGERLAVRLLHDGVIANREVLRYLNRLSDLIFILARYEESRAGHESRGTRR
ncbi:MAG: cob(I)yrinic acid a,c-diamide adenosyltransferase [Dehalococcoidia bacterium]